MEFIKSWYGILGLDMIWISSTLAIFSTHTPVSTCKREHPKCSQKTLRDDICFNFEMIRHTQWQAVCLWLIIAHQQSKNAKMIHRVEQASSWGRRGHMWRSRLPVFNTRLSTKRRGVPCWPGRRRRHGGGGKPGTKRNGNKISWPDYTRLLRFVYV